MGMQLGQSGEWRRDSWVRRLTPAEQTRVREETTELILLDARARTYQADRQGSEADQRQALEWAVWWLGRAERLSPRPLASLDADRARYLEALGQSEEAARDRAREASTPPATSRDFALKGTSLLAPGALGPAEDALRRATALDAWAFWAWFALGICHFEQGRSLESAGDFGVCMVLEPRFAWPPLNRGLVLARAGRVGDALACYDQALELNPNFAFAEALVNRASARLQFHDLEGAERDLTQAIARGRSDVSTLAASATCCPGAAATPKPKRSTTACSGGIRALPRRSSRGGFFASSTTLPAPGRTSPARWNSSPGTPVPCTAWRGSGIATTSEPP